MAINFHVSSSHQEITYRNNTKNTTFRAKPKLHGSNASANIAFENGQIRIKGQSRNTYCSKDNPHYGFYQYLTQKKDFFTKFYQKLDTTTLQNDSHPHIIVWGEFAGQGINNGASVCQLEKHCWFIFALSINERVYVEPHHIEAIFKLAGVDKETLQSEAIYILPWMDDIKPLIVDIAPNARDNLIQSVDELNACVAQIDLLDPYIDKMFGIKGSGEGIVFYPISLDASFDQKDDSSSQPFDPKMAGMHFDDQFAQYVFKVKGERHSVVATSKMMALETAQIESLDAFADMFVTPTRCAQAVQEVFSSPVASSSSTPAPVELKLRDTGRFIKWMLTDIEKESRQEREENNIAWSIQLKKVIEMNARQWYGAEINRRCVVQPEQTTN
eukprot:CAMPEP_0201546000 /NCGR_PEP_ID=MMETSP0173_2-20130828/2398_1 /ASSEMBLY_ACC=CAM_ASM_000268 /TAXON_ID=218659 /ORGANISM="Vexillifera sp., Strain DIVA3 564/2" /LENGTH=385 /DNA_ID=CAMNT_0047954571 /DNA_START=113 /DNA_END=1271 /DNA_ORIENTATION=+